ncbi:STYKc [Geosmithia morbida]|uniref:non-specific serine/threonine protein kinase n=1 Tax=Geosmithia morbida TaxID=1094350 RepID=A0A9P4Z300_9HYPO|nr:STYKc [Geosmithia morbida]KAF4126566.1 STYKc [Geosmithia morbida]
MSSPSPDPGPSQDSADAGQADRQQAPAGAAAVRFSSAIEEIVPESADSGEKDDASSPPQGIPSVQEPRGPAKPAQGLLLQERRLSTYQFETFSLPASRAASREDESSSDTSRLPTPNSPRHQHFPSHGSPKLTGVSSPPLTPSGSGNTIPDSKRPVKDADAASLGAGDGQAITPQASMSHDGKSPRFAQRQSLAHRPASSDHVPRRSTSMEDRQADAGTGVGVAGGADLRSHRRMLGHGGASMPGSRESSPSRTASSIFSKPMTPGGDINDPYAKGRRPPQSHHSPRTIIDPRFVFSRKKKSSSANSSTTNVSEKLAGGAFNRNSSNEAAVASDAASTHSGHASSMSDLKRFFKGGRHKGGHHHGHGNHHRNKSRQASPAPSATSARNTSASRAPQQVPFGEDHALTTKYGKIGRLLGAGAGGAVRLLKRKEDGTVFAVKEFRPKHAYESDREYAKKVTAEFCVGSTLHHGNIIETLDIVRENSTWYEVMEYAPYDLFATVMTGKMSREEVRCSFLQILNGVTYLHSLGLAHRDLKLDNVVINDRGIMKIIDFGSAHVFRYPFESDIVKAKGIVGSDPYLAPEVHKEKEYDAAAVDIWSLGIIFCCMTLRRFPWKVPQPSDNSYKLFASEPTEGHDPKTLVHPKKKASEHPDGEQPRSAPAEDATAQAGDASGREAKPGSEHAGAPPADSSGDGGNDGSAAAAAADDDDDPHARHHSPGHHGGHHGHHGSRHGGSHHGHHKRTGSGAAAAARPPEGAGGNDAAGAGGAADAAADATGDGPAPAEVTKDQQAQQQGEKKEVIRGPWRILRLLPRESRYIIWRMLDINPKTRATLEEILSDAWVADSQMCHQLDDGEVVPADDHKHVLQPPSAT